MNIDFYFSSFEEFIAMGGHGIYVWSVYAAALLFITWLIASPVIAKKQFFKQEAQRIAREQAGQQQKESS